MTRTISTQACIVGSGASGAIVADRLVRAGWDVVMLEQGPRWPPGTHLLDIEGDFRKAWARDARGRLCLQGHPWSACGVGGGARFYAGVSWRYREVDFDVSDHLGGDCLDVRWPIAYDDLRDAYDEVEHRLGVARAHGADPTEPPGAPPPLPPHAYSRRGRLIKEAAQDLGLKPFPTPLAINSVPYGGSPACERLTCCTDYACPLGAKGDPVTRLLDPLEQEENFRLLYETEALYLNQSRTTSVDSIDCLDLVSRERVVITAQIVVLAANAVQTAVLVLRSRNGYAPAGPGNSSGMVGRGLSFKATEYVYGRVHDAPESPEDDELEANLRGRWSSVALTDFYEDASCPTGLGGIIFEANPWLPFPPEPGVLLRLECLLGERPMPGNAVLLAGRPSGATMPRLVMEYRPHPEDLERLEFLVARTVDILERAGATGITREPSHYSLGSSHLHGTCRAGTDPKTSVVDRNGRFHDLANVFAVDGSYMPFAGGVNPTLTIQANALRIAEAIASEHGRPA